MPATSETLKICFEYVNSGDFERARNLLLATSDGHQSLEALCFIVREFGMPPTNEEYAEGFTNNARGDYPSSSAWVALAFGCDTDAWRSPNEADLYLEHERNEAARGPHEAASRLFAKVASCNYRIVKNNARPGFQPASTLTDLSIIGAANLSIRDPETALAKFREGIPKAEETAARRRAMLGANYQPKGDGGVSDIRGSCIAGEVLALRDLGRFREVAEALRRLRATPGAPVHLLAPLEAEAVTLASNAPFPVAWRRAFAEKVVDAPRGGPSGPNQKSGGCALPMMITLAGAGTALWQIIQL